MAAKVRGSFPGPHSYRSDAPTLPRLADAVGQCKNQSRYGAIPRELSPVTDHAGKLPGCAGGPPPIAVLHLLLACANLKFPTPAGLAPKISDAIADLAYQETAGRKRINILTFPDGWILPLLSPETLCHSLTAPEPAKVGRRRRPPIFRGLATRRQETPSLNL